MSGEPIPTIKSRVNLEKVDPNREFGVSQYRQRAGLARLDAVYKAIYLYRLQRIIPMSFEVIKAPDKRSDPKFPFRAAVNFIFTNCIKFDPIIFTRGNNYQQNILNTVQTLLFKVKPLFNAGYLYTLRPNIEECLFYSIDTGILFLDPVGFTFGDNGINYSERAGGTSSPTLVNFQKLKQQLSFDLLQSAGIESFTVKENKGKNIILDQKVIVAHGQSFAKGGVSNKYVNFLSGISKLLSREDTNNAFFDELESSKIDSFADNHVYSNFEYSNELKAYLGTDFTTKNMSYINYVNFLENYTS